jgi:hypothetical protein
MVPYYEPRFPYDDYSWIECTWRIYLNAQPGKRFTSSAKPRKYMSRRKMDASYRKSDRPEYEWDVYIENRRTVTPQASSLCPAVFWGLKRRTAEIKSNKLS